MSHLKERKEKNCLNCSAEVAGRFCQVCGQENLEPKESFWHLITHFFNDITHFDGKFFTTMKYLVTKPGFASKEYMLGKRASNLNPVRMYVFTSAIFFLVFFSVTHFDEKNIHTKINGVTAEEIEKMDSVSFADFTRQLNNGIPFNREQFRHYVDTSRKKGTFQVAPGNYSSEAAYDSVLKSGVKKHNWFERMLVHKQIELDQKYQRDGNRIMASFINKLMHSFPQMLFISLPLFALLLKLLYYRRKNFYYTDHAIFGIHLYIFVFLVLLFFIGLNQLKLHFGWYWTGFLQGAGIIYIFYYQLKAMRNFYGQRWGKTILKFFLLNISMLMITILIMTAFALFSLFKI